MCKTGIYIVACKMNDVATQVLLDIGAKCPCYHISGWRRLPGAKILDVRNVRSMLRVTMLQATSSVR